MTRAGTVIVGGGISGASLLHWLAEHGEDVLLLEATDRLGGVIGSYRTPAGTLVEQGPNSTQISSEPLQRIVREVGVEESMMTADARASKRFIVRAGRPVALPSGPGAFIGTPLWRSPAKLRLLREPFIGPASADADESVAEFVERRLGREFLDYAINPFVSGVYAGSPERLSVRYAFPKLHELEQQYGSLIRGAIGRMRETRRSRKDMVGAPKVSGLISFDEGMEVLPRAIFRRHRSRVSTGARVEAVEQLPDAGWKITSGGEEIICERLVMAAGARSISDLIESFAPDAAAALRRLEYPPVATVTSVYRRQDVIHPLDGFGALVPEVEKRQILGVIFSSTLFPNRGPAGTVVLTTFVGGARQPELALQPHDEIAAMVHRELISLLGAHGSPLEVVVNSWPEAIPQYNLGHGDILAAIEQLEAQREGLHILGNYRGGISVGDCVKSASELAERIMAHDVPRRRTSQAESH